MVLSTNHDDSEFTILDHLDGRRVDAHLPMPVVPHVACAHDML